MKVIAMDSNKIREAVKAGLTANILQQLEDRFGVVFALDGKVGFLHTDAADVLLPGKTRSQGITYDAQPELVTVSNAGIPAWLTNWFDPKLVEILTAPLEAVNIIGAEVKKGDWTTNTATFASVEYVGEVAAYGDFNNNGSSNINTNFPQRQSFSYQNFTQWGEKQLDINALARVDYANRVNKASMTTMAQFQNNSYFFGISGLQNYGLLNDPSLPPAIVAAGAWSAATAEAIYNDVVRLFRQLQLQSNGVIDARASMTMALSPTLEAWLDKANQYGLTARKLIASNYPNLTIKTAVQYGQQFGGELIQFICNEVQGNRTAEAAFTEKMRAHAVVVGHSSWSQKKSAGTFGTVIYQPFAIASMTGA